MSISDRTRLRPRNRTHFTRRALFTLGAALPLAAGPAFWARVDALGGKPCYPPADIRADPASHGV